MTKTETKAPEAKAETPDPFANLTAEPVENLFTGGGRPAKPVPASVMALVVQSYNGGNDGLKLRVPVADEATAKELSKLLRKGGEQHDPALTVRVTTEKDEAGNPVAVRFLAGKKIVRQEKPATEAKAS